MAKIPICSVPGQGAVRSARSWRAAAVAACAASALVTACSSSGGGSSTGPGAAGRPLTPTTAIQLAADQTQKVTSLAGSITVQFGSQGVNGTFQFQLKPSVLVAENLNTSIGGQTMAVNEILSGAALYLKIPALAAATGKPWIKVNFSSMSGGLGDALGQFLQDAQTSDPQAQTQELTGSKDAHQVGTQIIDGVKTTHYAGTLTASAALGRLSPSLRKDLSSSLSQLHGNITWNAWIDSLHNLRKLTESYTVGSSAFSLAQTVTSINQPVTATLPPTNQVTVMRAGDLSGSGLAGGTVSPSGS